MIEASTQRPDSNGWFEGVVGPASGDWPWALPHLFAVNVAADPGIEVVGASASADGMVSVRERWLAERHRLEIVGYWRGAFGLVHLTHAATAVQARSQGRAWLESRRVRFLMIAGQVVEEDPAVEVTGEWPTLWKIDRLADLGAFCSFLVEKAKAGGGEREAAKFRESISAAWPATEQLAVFVRSMEMARNDLRGYFDEETRGRLEAVLCTARDWLIRGGPGPG